MNKWIQHVKKYAKKHKITYKKALTEAKKTYKQKGDWDNPYTVLSINNNNNREIKNQPFPVTMHINVSWATQLNKIAGTEKNFVIDCKKQKYNNAKDNSSVKCTTKLANIINNMKNNKPNIITIVEAIDKTKELFLNTIFGNYTLFEHNEGVSKVIIGVEQKYQDEYKFKKIFGMNLSQNDDRPLIVLYSSNKKILFLCGHFPHNSNFNELFKTITDKVNEKNVNVIDIIFTGDFNDHMGTLLGEYLTNKNKLPTITILNKKLYMGNGIDDIPITCCYPRRTDDGVFESIGYDKYADYIFSTIPQSKFGALHTFTNEYKYAINKYKLSNDRKTLTGTKLGSDHEPVLAIF